MSLHSTHMEILVSQKRIFFNILGHQYLHFCTPYGLEISIVCLFSRVLCNDIKFFPLGGKRKFLQIKISSTHFKTCSFSRSHGADHRTIFSPPYPLRILRKSFSKTLGWDTTLSWEYKAHKYHRCFVRQNKRAQKLSHAYILQIREMVVCVCG